MSYIVPLEMPKTCFECFLLSEPEYIGVEKVYIKEYAVANLHPKTYKTHTETWNGFVITKKNGVL